MGEGGYRNAAGATEGCEIQPKPRPAGAVIKDTKGFGT